LKNKLTTSITILLLLVFTGTTTFGASGGVDGEFNPSAFIIDHIVDSHEWHLWTKQNGESVSIYLPVILYSKSKGFEVFSSKKISHGHIHNGYKIEEGVIVSVDTAGNIDEANIPLDLSITKTP
jgi:F-type H+-transporting ATPase subunit a